MHKYNSQISIKQTSSAILHPGVFRHHKDTDVLQLMSHSR